MNYVSLDFGASTTDLVKWQDGKIKKIVSFEAEEVRSGLEDFLREQEDLIKGVEKVFVTGGKSRDAINRVSTSTPIVKVSEIEAIGRGGRWLVQNGCKGKVCLALTNEPFLVVSMGTGTCLVKVQSGFKPVHVGGTGVGGGTFLGLAREILGITDIQELIAMFNKGDRWKVDLSVKDIVGGGIGIIPENVTASNLGKLSRSSWQGEEIDFSKEDLAAGIANLVGQTIATAAVFAARAERIKTIVFGGKLSRIEQITEIIFEVGKVYGMTIVLPTRAEYISAIGAGVGV